ncbi:MAG: hypothetical protein ABI550_05310, partial [Ignavibacteriaceae bacterium]
AEKARGFFIAIGVGPRFPMGDFATTTDLGYGLNIEFSYTDNKYLPFFLFARVGYEQFPGSTNFYKATEYSNFSTATIPVNMGLRYYFPPLLENVVLFIPIIEVSAAYTYLEKLHQFKQDSGRNNFTEDISKVGISVGAGISMFVMEILASYNYLQTNQSLLIDFKIRLPLFINF